MSQVIDHQFPPDPAARRTAIGIRRLQWRLGGIARDSLAVLRFWTARQRTRRALSKLIEEPHALRDIGLTRAQARREAAKRFWMR